MVVQYLIRLDDACPTMNKERWDRMESLLDHYGIKPMVGVIPHNEDPEQNVNPEDECFWDKVKNWTNKGWEIALHGYNHCYLSNDGLKGLNPMWQRSEFAGLSIDAQRKKIKDGISIMRKHEVNPLFFFAPSHTFDENTLTALREESDIRFISDTIALRPYHYKDFTFSPQIVGSARHMPLSGIYTFCYHPNTMNDSNFKELESFIKEYQRSFISFQDIDVQMLKKKSLIDRVLSVAFFSYRRLRNLK